MKTPRIISILLGVLMLSSGILTKSISTKIQPEDMQSKFNLEIMIPREFDDWRIDPASEVLLINNDNKGLLDKIYSQTLARTYINSKDERVMLSIAYGSEQRADMQIHRPEICYAASGFDIGKITSTFIDTAIGRIPVRSLVATQNSRNEPITYWVRVGDSLTQGWVAQKFTAILYGLTGKTPDGLLFRVSTISNVDHEAFLLQHTFLNSVLQAVRKEDRHLLVGQLTQL